MHKFKDVIVGLVWSTVGKRWLWMIETEKTRFIAPHANVRFKDFYIEFCKELGHANIN